MSRGGLMIGMKDIKYKLKNRVFDKIVLQYRAPKRNTKSELAQMIQYSCWFLKTFLRTMLKMGLYGVNKKMNTTDILKTCVR